MQTWKFPRSFHSRLAVATVFAIIVGMGLFLVSALLIEYRKPSATVHTSSGVTVINAKVNESKSSLIKRDLGKTVRTASGSGLDELIPLNKAPEAEHLPYLPEKRPDLVRGKPLIVALRVNLKQLAERDTQAYLGMTEPGHEHQKWVQAAGGLIYLPDSGLRVKQTHYECPRSPIDHGKLRRTKRLLVTAIVTRQGNVTNIDISGGASGEYESLRRSIETGWRFKPLVINGESTSFRLRFVNVIEYNMHNVIGYHCEWTKFNSARRGDLTPTWILYVPPKGLPIAYAYIAPQHPGDAAGGLAPTTGQSQDPQ